MNIQAIEGAMEEVYRIENLCDFINLRYFYDDPQIVRKLYAKVQQKYAKIDGFTLFENGKMNRGHYVRLLYAKKLRCFGDAASEVILRGMYSELK